MNGEKITVSWDELKTAAVDRRLREQDAMDRNRRQAEPDLMAGANLQPARGSIWYNALFRMGVFGLLGGLLAWAAGELLLLRPSATLEADELVASIRQVENAALVGRITQESAEAAIREIVRTGAANPYFVVRTDPNIDEHTREQRLTELRERDRFRNAMANLLAYGLAGMLVAMALATAEPLVDRNFAATASSGTLAAVIGLVGGGVVALLIDRLPQLLPRLTPHSGGVDVARVVTFAVLGLFLAAAPGIALRNTRKLLIGLAGGLLGGAIGGALFDPLARLTGLASVSRLVAMLAIGGVTGFAIAMIEDAAKTGWLRVTRGLIAGKQFILYRNPTFIGSSPECQIYLFKDPQVGRRHAAVHVLPNNAFEIEDLPLGTPTRVNTRPITRTRLRDGDQIDIGGTTMVFQAKES